MIPELLAVSLVWTESSHADFADGHEYYYLGGDSATVWQEDRLWTWRIGSRIYSPASGGLRIIGQDIDIDDDGWLDLPLASWCLGPSLVYWGPHLSERSEINPGGSPSMWANGIFVADLNEDGRPELLIANEVTNEGPHVSSYIFTYDGMRSFRLLDSIPYPLSLGAQGIQPADLDNDGLVDLVIANSKDYAAGSWDVSSYIIWGGGRSPQALPTPGGHPTSIADLDGDGFLDIIFPSNCSDSTGWETDMVIYRGRRDGAYSLQDTMRLPACNNWECQVADLNGDGWLDIIAVNGKDNQGYYTADRIYWGPDFSSFTELPGVASSNITVGDLNMDGFLDLLISNWARGVHGAETLQTYSYIRYGPDYVSGPVDSLITYGAHGNLIADWNGDGWPDIFIGNEMDKWGEYCRSSYVFWNSGGGFSQDNATLVEDWAPNDCIWTDLGNLRDREPVERYLSSELTCPWHITSVDSLKVFGNTPDGISVKAWVRSGRGPRWNRWVRVGEGGRPEEPIPPGNRLQYRLAFELDYKKTTLFRIDSLKVFYRAETFSGITEEPPAQAEVSELYDAAGRLVKTGAAEQLPKGIYFKVTKRRGKTTSAKVIVRTG